MGPDPCSVVDGDTTNPKIFEGWGTARRKNSGVCPGPDPRRKRPPPKPEQRGSVIAQNWCRCPRGSSGGVIILERPENTGVSTIRLPWHVNGRSPRIRHPSQKPCAPFRSPVGNKMNRKVVTHEENRGGGRRHPRKSRRVRTGTSRPRRDRPVERHRLRRDRAEDHGTAIGDRRRGRGDGRVHPEVRCGP